MEKKPKHDSFGEERQGGFGFLSHCGSQVNTVAYQQDQVPHALRENPSYQLQYLISKEDETFRIGIYDIQHFLHQHIDHQDRTDPYVSTPYPLFTSMQ